MSAALACAFPAAASAAVAPQSQFGTTGTGAGQFTGSISIEVGPANGDVYVGDFATNRINQFSSNGTFVRAWGHDVIPGGASGFEKCTTATGCQPGTQGGGAGEMNSADGIAAAANGDLFVTEFNDNRVSQFTANGDFVRAFGFGVGGGAGFEICTGPCQVGSFGNGAGQMSSPNSIAVSGNDVYVTQTSGNRVNRYSLAGGNVTPAGSFGSSGSAAGQLLSPRGVAIAPGGNVVVSDNANNRISEFTSNGTFVRAWGFGVDTGANAFEICTTASGCQAGIAGSEAGQFSDGGGAGAPAVAVDSAGTVFVGDDGNQRIAQHAAGGGFTQAWGFGVDTGAVTFEICTTASGCQVGTGAPGLGALAAPSDVAIDPVAGRVLVIDFNADRVTAYTGATPAAPTPGPADPGATDPGPAAPGPADPGPNTPARPSNDFEIGKAELNSKKGTATLPVEVPGAGRLALEGKDVKPASASPTRAATVDLEVKPKGKLKEKLADKGKATASVEVTFTPTGGDANSVTKGVKLKLK